VAPETEEVEPLRPVTQQIAAPKVKLDDRKKSVKQPEKIQIKRK